MHTENKKCNFCGEDIGYSLRRCPYCGSLVGDNANNPDPSYNERQDISATAPDKPLDTDIGTINTGAVAEDENHVDVFDNYERELPVNRFEPEKAQTAQEEAQSPIERHLDDQNVTNRNTLSQGTSLNGENYNSGSMDSFDSNVGNRQDMQRNSGYRENSQEVNRLGNGMKVFLTVISTIPWIGQLIGIISAIVFMNSEYDTDRKSFGLALLIASVVLFVIVSCLGCLIGMGLTENEFYY